MYRASGYDPEDKATDNGWSMEAAASHAQHTGLRDTTGVQHFAGPWMQIDHVDQLEVQIALDMFGPMPVGCSLPIAAQHQTTWDTDGSDGDQTPGGWGGHSLTLVGFDHLGVTLLTWGSRQRATWAWWARYVDEAIVAVDPLWCSDLETAPNGFALAELLAAQGVLR